MIVTFAPTETERRSYEFKAKRLMSVESELLEQKVGKPYPEVVNDVMKGSALARRALVFVFERRVHPGLSWDAFDFPYDAVEIEFDADELSEVRVQVESAVGISDTDRATALAELDRLAAEAPPVPKAPEPSVEPAT